MTDNYEDDISDTDGTISQTQIYILVIWQSNVQRLANMLVIILASVHGNQYHSSHDGLDFPHRGGKESLEVYVSWLVGNDVAIVQLLLWRVIYSYRPGDSVYMTLPMQAPFGLIRTHSDSWRTS